MSKKQEIILAAQDIIHSKGYQATSISDILSAANIGKGQFYHYFSSKHDLGLAVIDHLILERDIQLIEKILKSSEDPKLKLNKMLDWIFVCHAEKENKPGCPIGNLAIEMSEHDESFRIRIQQYFERWTEAIAENLEELIKLKQLDSSMNSKKRAEAMVAMIEGGILLMKNQLNTDVLKNILDSVRKQYHLS
ncbi:TetR/AcrR family transcriptional regulator [Bacillus sp. 03113]|uniref:TetR/AcrR family transcriptional regulator n=1 Tax=Bacillus sp. 03113 TaxID=2578211 RepID=UPI0011428EA6|nr:TetR/AcrR family transcriptional regulator [Bacillus sp. 03113]